MSLEKGMNSTSPLAPFFADDPINPISRLVSIFLSIFSFISRPGR